jgi:hypothetical protein
VLPNVRFLTFAGHQRNVFADTKSAFTPNDVFTTVIRLVIISGTATSQVAGVVRPVGKLGTSAPHMFRWPHRCDPMFRSMKRHRTWALSNLSGSPSRSPIRDFKKKGPPIRQPSPSGIVLFWCSYWCRREVCTYCDVKRRRRTRDLQPVLPTEEVCTLDHIFKAISHLLFNMVADSLTRMVLKAQQSDLVCGLIGHLITKG